MGLTARSSRLSQFLLHAVRKPFQFIRSADHIQRQRVFIGLIYSRLQCNSKAQHLRAFSHHLLPVRNFCRARWLLRSRMRFRSCRIALRYRSRCNRVPTRLVVCGRRGRCLARYPGCPGQEDSRRSPRQQHRPSCLRLLKIMRNLHDSTDESAFAMESHAHLLRPALPSRPGQFLKPGDLGSNTPRSCLRTV